MKAQNKKKKKNTRKLKKNSLVWKSLVVLNILQCILVIFLLIYISNTKGDVVELKNENKKLASDTAKDLKDDNYVFLGDSITDWYPIYDFFSTDTPIINSGFAGDKTKDLLSDMEEKVYRYNPTKVFIQIGTNDLNSEDSNGEIAYKNIIKMVKNIKKNRPYAKIYIESIYPVNQTDDEKINKNTTGKRTNEDIMNVNSKLEEYCKKNDVVYIDIYNRLLDDGGNLKIEYTDDGLHLSPAGYSVVSDELKKYIEEK